MISGNKVHLLPKSRGHQQRIPVGGVVADDKARFGRIVDFFITVAEFEFQQKAKRQFEQLTDQKMQPPVILFKLFPHPKAPFLRI
jgi:hypothetical protein